MTLDRGPIERLMERAAALAGAWGARARASTTIGQERAVLRLFGVHGVDPHGRPLAGATVDRWLAADPAALGGGIALPFAMALLEYDLEPQQLALDVAAGTIDLGLEAELLLDADRRAVAQAEARRLAATAAERIDAQRTVRREILGMLGDADRPWLGATLREPDVDDALEEAERYIAAGVDVIRVEVPIGRELADRLTDAGIEVPAWQPQQRTDPSSPDAADPAPTGSQRALGRLREAIDRSAARRGSYVRLVTAPPALGSPEGAVVAVFERIDIVTSDPMTEIVVGSVEPERALADHAFMHRLVRRSGASIHVGPGPLVVAPDLSAGQPSDPATRAGRALALQLLSVALARTDGLSPDQILVGALPQWLTDEPAAGALGLAEVVVRHHLFPDHQFVFTEPPRAGDPLGIWPFIQAAAAVHAGSIGMVVRTFDPTPATPLAVRSARGSSRVTADVAAATIASELTGVAAEHARAMVEAALLTLDRIDDLGWHTVAGDGPGDGRPGAIRRDVAVERTEAFDPFEPDRD